MANNRMILICNACNPVGEVWTFYDEQGNRNPGILVMGKWDPGSSYARRGEEPNKLPDFLEAHGHVGSEFEEYPIRFEYEIAK